MKKWLLIGTILAVFVGLGQLGNEHYKNPTTAFLLAFFFMMLIVAALPISTLIANHQSGSWKRLSYAVSASLLAGILAFAAFRYSVNSDKVGVEFVSGPHSDVAFVLPVSGSQFIGICIFIVYFAMSAGLILLSKHPKNRN